MSQKSPERQGSRKVADGLVYQAGYAMRLGKLQESALLAEKAVRADRHHLQAHRLLADLYYNRLKDFGRAMPHLDFLTRHPRGDPSDRFFLAHCYFQCRAYKMARETFQAYIEGVAELPPKHRTEHLRALRDRAQSLIETCDQTLEAQVKAQAKARAASGKTSPLAAAPAASAATPAPAAADAAPRTPEPCMVQVKFTFPGLEDGARLIAERLRSERYEDYEDYALRLQYQQLTLIKEFDELLCLPGLKNVDHYWYQVETVKNVLKHFRGRALLADEVGLGKTIEAGMIIKEYITRGLVKRALVLAPASLLSQWQEELLSKFEVPCLTTDLPLYRQDPDAFWQQPGVILASLQLARHPKNLERLAALDFDLVVVDEAHYLKNRRSQNYKLVNSLKKKFILLLSATPVHNNLVELYNLITLIKPGLLKTEAQFKREYVKRGNPRMPVNSDTLRQLLREVMIRNTRSLVDVKLPRRFAATVMVPPSPAETEVYQLVTGFIRARYDDAPPAERMALHVMQEEAGSSPFALQQTLEKRLARPETDAAACRELEAILRRIHAMDGTEKGRRLLEMVQSAPAKTLVFTKYLATLYDLSALLRGHGVPHAVYRGGMTLAEKDAAVAEFREGVDLLLCTESGGEGRNLQFANTIVNFDLPWNPMRIEQRIGRIHRIGQTQDVFVFNFCLKDSIEDYILRVLDQKINMFELVVGEIDTILGNLETDSDFSDIIMGLWARAHNPEDLETGFDQLGDQLLAAKREYQDTKALDDALLGEDYEV